MAPVDLSATSGVHFYVRGDGGTYRVLLFTRSSGRRPLVQRFTVGNTWAHYTFHWNDFQGSDGSAVRAIAIVGGPKPGPYALLIDQVKLE